MKSVINTKSAPSPVGPYNQAILVNGFLFVSGQIGINPSDGTICNTGIQDETRQIFRNIEAILSKADMNFENVVKCTVFVKNMQNYGPINEIYSEFFDDDSAPARELVEVSALPKYVNVEISAIAAK